jgi:hypothetical protein
MTMNRSIQVLVNGLRAAHERMFSDRGLRRPEYPRSLSKLYSDMEDGLCALYSAVRSKQYALVRETAADIVVTASEMIEYVELLENVADEPWDTEK